VGAGRPGGKIGAKVELRREEDDPEEQGKKAKFADVGQHQAT
jgi:hypothetical protein